MKYCTGCGSEYQANVGRCSDCGGEELVSADEMHRRGLPIMGEVDTRRFVRAGTAEDPLTAEQLVGALLEAHLTVFSRPRRAGVVDGVTSGFTGAWWDILVPEAEAAKAADILERERASLEKTADEAARAAEEEAEQTLGQGPDGAAPPERH